MTFRSNVPQTPSHNRTIPSSPALASVAPSGLNATALTQSSEFFKRLKARPYGGVLLTNANYAEPQQLSALTQALHNAARDAGHRRRSSRRRRRAGTSTRSATSLRRRR